MIKNPTSIRGISANYSVGLTDQVLLVNCTAGAVTLTLPPAAAGTNTMFYFKKIDSSDNAMTLSGLSGQDVDGASSVSTTVQYVSLTLVTDGSNWYII
jgi:hypothetical protein